MDKSTEIETKKAPTQPTPQPRPPPQKTPTPTPTTTTTTTTTNNSNPCVLASTLSATSVILFLLIAGLVYFLYIRKKRIGSSKCTTIETPKKPKKSNQYSGTAESLRNYGYQPEQEYKVPPKREVELPRKTGEKERKTISPYHGPIEDDENYYVEPPRKYGEKEHQTLSPYHATIEDDGNYRVPPVRTDTLRSDPPLPPNLRKKMERQNKNSCINQQEEVDPNESGYYLDMDCVKNDLYENVGASNDDIYINH